MPCHAANPLNAVPKMQMSPCSTCYDTGIEQVLYSPPPPGRVETKEKDTTNITILKALPRPASKAAVDIELEGSTSPSPPLPGNCSCARGLGIARALSFRG